MLVALDLVDLSQSGFVVDPRYYRNGWADCPKILGRASAVDALIRAKQKLPQGWNFKVWDMYRTREVQVRMIGSFRNRIREAHPEWTERMVMREVYRFAARAKHKVSRPDCHRNGGAVDLTIVDYRGREVDMGTDHDDLTERARSDYFQSLLDPTPEDRTVLANRCLLKRVMETSGFEGLLSEWWHWSTSL